MTKDEALAGEPVTWGVDWSNVGDIPCASIIKRLPDGGIEVLAVEYGPPRPWVGLTDEEIDKTHETKVWDARRSFARAIEAKLKDKNTITAIEEALTIEVAADPKAFYGFPHGPVSTPNAGGKCVTAGETAPKEST